MKIIRLIMGLGAGLTVFIAGCASVSGVQIERAVATPPAIGDAVHVIGENPDTVRSATRALRERGWLVGEGGDLVLRTYTTISSEARSRPDPFCDPWRAPGYRWMPGWGPYGYMGGFSNTCRPWRDRRWEVFPVRTVTWSLEGHDRSLLWHASSREQRPAGPPIGPSNKLAQAMSEWQGGER